MPTGFTNTKEFVLSLRRVSAEIAEEVQTARREIGLSALSKLVLKTPVDEGEARGGWQVSTGAPPGSPPKRRDRSGQATIAGGSAKIVRSTRSKQAYKRTLITNGVPHIGTLENGGFRPRDPATDEESLARRAAGRAERQRKRAQDEHGHPGAPFVRGGYSLQAPQGMVAVSFEELRTEFRLT